MKFLKRNKILSTKVLTKKGPEKGLTFSLKNHSGHNNKGRITVRHQGGGAKRLYRVIDFGQEKIDIKGIVIALEYDPFRTAFIMLVEYLDKEKRYKIAPAGVKVGDEIMCAEKAEIKPGNRMKIKNIPVGTLVHNIELEPGRGGIITRSAGSSARVLAHEGKYTNLEMSSAEVRKVLQECYAAIGPVSRPEWRYTVIGKAGSSRHRGIRPTVRGSAMNPCDHPHGGGEGRTGIGLKYPKTPWGKHALGVKTRGEKWTNKFIIQRRVKKQ